MDKPNAELWYQQAQIVEGFLSEVVDPHIRPTIIDASIDSLYVRLKLWLGSMVRLASPNDYQAHMAGARAALETAVDLTFLANDKDGSAHEALHLWERCEKLRAAERAIRYRTKAGLPLDVSQASYVANEKTAIQQDAIAFGWKETSAQGAVTAKPPQRWTRRSLETDCEKADALVTPELHVLRNFEFALAYADTYAWMCWNTHGSGLVAQRVATPNNMHGLAMYGFMFVQRFALYAGALVLQHHGVLDQHQRHFDKLHERVGTHLILTKGLEAFE